MTVLRRSLLSAVIDDELKFSFAIRLVDKYLATKNLTLSNAADDPVAMQIGKVKLDRVHPNTGGYVNLDARENQVLLNYRRRQR